jgi:hypothetical protein
MPESKPHQVIVDDNFKTEIRLYESEKDNKVLLVRLTLKVTDFVVVKDGLRQVFTNLAAAVKKYNG